MEDTIESLTEELDVIKKNLKNPMSVMINMLYGNISKLSWDFIERVHGPHPVRAELETVKNKLNSMSPKPNKNVTPVSEKPSAPKPNTSSEVVSRFSVKNGVVSDDSSGTFVKFADYKAVSRKNEVLVKDGEKLIKAHEKSLATEVGKVIDDTISALQIATAAINGLEDGKYRDKLIKRLISTAKRLGLEVDSSEIESAPETK